MIVCLTKIAFDHEIGELFLLAANLRPNPFNRSRYFDEMAVAASSTFFSGLVLRVGLDTSEGR